MKILHVITTLSSGGAEKMLVDIVKEMKRQSINCEVLIMTKEGDFFGKQLAALNIPVFYGETKSVYSLKNILFIRKILMSNHYDCIHTHLFAAQLFTAIACKLLLTRKPLITTEHSTHNKRREKSIFFKLDKWMYSQYEKIIAISSGTKYNLAKYLPETENKIVVIKNGIEINRYEKAIPIKRSILEKGFSEEEKMILMVAAMREQKDHETLIRASKLLPEDYRVVFVGDGERLSNIKSYAKDRGRENILFLGKRSDIPEIMKSADVFVLSSKWEGFGLVVLEAAATGLPIVASDVEGLKEVVQDIGGMLFKKGDEKELAEKIIISVSNHVMLSQHENLENYTVKKTVASYIEVYQKTLSENGY